MAGNSNTNDETKAEEVGGKTWRPHLAEEKDYEALRELFMHHIDSFDHMVEHGLERMLLSVKPYFEFGLIEVLFLTNEILWFENPEIYPPQKERSSRTMADALYPFECRQAKLTYAGRFMVDVKFQYDDGVSVREKINFGQFPVMLKSKLCHLRGANDPKKLVRHKEEPSEMGGYFIMNGLERVIRLLILPKRNYPMSMVRNSFRERRDGYTDKAVVIRCVREDQSAVTVKLYYLNNGSARLGFWIQGREYLLPVGIIRYHYLFSYPLRVSLLFNALQCFSDMVIFVSYKWEHFQPLMVGLEKESYSVLHVAEAVFSRRPDFCTGQPGFFTKPRSFIAWTLNNYLSQVADVKKVIEKNTPRQIGSAIENLLKTGRLVTQSGLDLQQRAGMTVQAERLNFLRFLSHFRAVHRGASFAGLRTTSVRKLLPESWGFLCPVHTPDGEPCGLLNHMTSSCRITSYYDSKGKVKDFHEVRKSILKVLVSIGMTPSLPKLVQAGPPEVLPVLLDGRVVGSIASDIIEKAVCHLRRLKVAATFAIPEDLEVGYIPLSMGGAYPGLHLFTSASRFVRPVRNILIPPEEGNNIELIGPFEQVYMEISCPDGGDGGRKDVFPATHEEIHPTGILSVVGNLTPWSDHNQSPRNMYQCQMGKQTMGFSCQALIARADQKLYHLQTETIDLTEQNLRSDRSQRSFGRSNLDRSAHHLIDSDGLPYVGQRISPNEPYCSIYNEITSKVTTNKLKGSEPVYVDYVAVDVKNKKHIQKANIRLRHPRNPIIGDKFSSRHGQKGVCSQLWPDTDMPFSGVTGMRPDLIINPHAFPSRMTIAMLLESIAAKGGALHGNFVDATPFSSSMKKNSVGSESDSSSLVDELGSMLIARGFNYHGVEVLYSGVYGTELTCEIFIGPVYYQRLRHMVSDKFQVRSTGTVDQVTRQPIKGRKRGGGIRFGEMERDSLLAHGAAYLLHDRLHTSSDHHIADVCSFCGSILTTSLIQSQKKAVRDMIGRDLPPGRVPKKVTCVACQTSKGMETVAMPYVFRYLAAELAAMNIKMTLQLSSGPGA
ncbi:UNVERIFIED_CONTAM: DNA-directed RNA polymerase I subunit [Sesamum calycinum]|uniref:DNA-directed RNA polymerase subunit beta n=1 Tax=Sesamum calycinum TaxID=2727403 RepID=A0AAW2SZG1_9LAMI